jgi:hypothetical protein
MNPENKSSGVNQSGVNQSGVNQSGAPTPEVGPVEVAQLAEQNNAHELVNLREQFKTVVYRGARLGMFYADFIKLLDQQFGHSNSLLPPKPATNQWHRRMYQPADQSGDKSPESTPEPRSQPSNKSVGKLGDKSGDEECSR